MTAVHKATRAAAMTVVLLLALAPAAVAQVAPTETYSSTLSVGPTASIVTGTRALCSPACTPQPLSLALVRNGVEVAASAQSVAPALGGGAGFVLPGDVISLRVDTREQRSYSWDGRPTIDTGLAAGTTAIGGLFTLGHTVTAGTGQQSNATVSTAGDTYNAAFAQPVGPCTELNVRTQGTSGVVGGPVLNVVFTRAAVTPGCTTAAPGGGPVNAPGGTGVLPPPVRGRLVNVAVVRGVVTIRRPGGRVVTLRAGEQIPVGSVVDTRRGTVRLTVAGAGGVLESAIFFDGIFRVSQSSGARPITELRLIEVLAPCPRRRGTGSVRAAQRKAKRAKTRRLWGDGKGAFRTRGRRSSAIVSGTKWLVQDSCAGTLTRVKQGRVSVRDFARRRTITVRAGGRYLAR